MLPQPIALLVLASAHARIAMTSPTCITCGVARATVYTQCATCRQRQLAHTGRVTRISGGPAARPLPYVTDEARLRYLADDPSDVAEDEESEG